MEWERDIEAEELLRTVERKEELRLALMHLNPLQIALLLLSVHHSFSVKDAGRICGLNPLQAQTVYEDAVRILRRVLG
jgi:DNA-directed RNA polymerase specialized sigma24 family protein